ncbi:MAG: crossover junction endodeoxyribonuclease RuvC, partial [Elusimicrobia bacterium CG08_land_8_20_14_0_20_51_18]
MSGEKKIILGIDPGLDRTGWSVLWGSGGRQEILRYGLIHTEAGTPLPERLEKIFDELTSVIEENRPEEAAVEEVFFSKRAGTQASTTHARGVILLALRKKGVKIYPYNPRAVKQNLTGNGNADKKQMERMVQLAFSLKKPIKPDDISDS